MRTTQTRSQNRLSRRRPSRSRASESGIALHDVLLALMVTAVLSTMALPVGRSGVATYELSAATTTVCRDLERARLKALEANAEVMVSRESERSYRIAERVQRLPKGARFSSTSADSLVFNRLGAVSDGGVATFVIELGDRSRELRVGAAGAVEGCR